MRSRKKVKKTRPNFGVANLRCVRKRGGGSRVITSRDLLAQDEGAAATRTKKRYLKSRSYSYIIKADDIRVQ